MLASLDVDRRELGEALQMLRRLTDRKSRGDVVLSFAERRLDISCGGASRLVDALGEWPGRALVASDTLLELGRSLPDADPLRVEVHDGELRIESLKLPCEWLPRSGPQIELPLNPTLPLIMSVKKSFSPEEIHQAGLSPLLDSAVLEYARVVDDVFKRLSPYGVTRTAIVELITSALPELDREFDLSGFAQEQARLPLEVHGEQLDLAD